LTEEKAHIVPEAFLGTLKMQGETGRAMKTSSSRISVSLFIFLRAKNGLPNVVSRDSVQAFPFDIVLSAALDHIPEKSSFSVLKSIFFRFEIEFLLFQSFCLINQILMVFSA